jgi:hypothetical protein
VPLASDDAREPPVEVDHGLVAGDTRGHAAPALDNPMIDSDAGQRASRVGAGGRRISASTDPVG